MKLQKEIDSESENKNELIKVMEESLDTNQKASLNYQIGKSEEKVEAMMMMMIHYCAGLQHCLDQEEEEKQKGEGPMEEEGGASQSGPEVGGVIKNGEKMDKVAETVEAVRLKSVGAKDRVRDLGLVGEKQGDYEGLDGAKKILRRSGSDEAVKTIGGKIILPDRGESDIKLDKGLPEVHSSPDLIGSNVGTKKSENDFYFVGGEELDSDGRVFPSITVDHVSGDSSFDELLASTEGNGETIGQKSVFGDEYRLKGDEKRRLEEEEEMVTKMLQTTVTELIEYSDGETDSEGEEGELKGVVW